VPYKNALRLSVSLVLLCLAAVAFGQEAPAVLADDPFGADFEAALFGDTGDAEDQGPVAESPTPGANDAEAAAFSAFTAAASGSDAVTTTYQVGGNALARVDTVLQPTEGEALSSSSAAGKLFAKVSVPDYGSLYIAYNLSHYFFQASSAAETPVPPGGDFDPYAPEYALSEFHYSFDINKTLFVRLGNQLIAWGPARIWTPVDFINLQKTDAFAALDSRTGKPGLRLHVPLSSANAFVFADFSGLQPDGATYNDLTADTNLGGRFDFTTRAFEFGLTAYGGQHAQVRYGADFSGRLLGVSVYGEAAAGIPYDGYDYYLQSALGFSRALGELKEWTFSAEGFYNSREDETTYLYTGNWYAYAALSADKFIVPSLTATLSVLANLEDRSYAVKLAQTLSLPRAVPFTFEASYAGGGDNKELTSFVGDKSVSLSLFTTLSF